MTTVIYDIKEVTHPRHGSPIALDAYAAVVRLDERARHSPLTHGWQERSLFDEALACQLAEGNLVHMDDLVLLDGNLRQGKTHPDLRDTLDMLRVLRRAATEDPATLLRADRPGLANVDEEIPEQAPHRYVQIISEEPCEEAAPTNAEALAQWRRVVTASEQLPAIVAAAIAWDMWLELLPEPGGSWRASLLAALVLRQRGATSSFLLPVDSGRRISTYRRKLGQEPHDRLLGVISWMHAAATRGYKQFDALSLAKKQMRRHASGKRSSSRLNDLIDVFLSRPLVTVPLAANLLGCSKQAVAKMLPLLKSTPVLLTEGKRCRAWRVA